MARGAIVLMYHAIGLPDERASRYVLPLRRFRSQLRLLALLGYRIVPLTEVVTEADEPGRRVALTFDDGYADNRVAFDELSRRGLPATLFAVSGSNMNDWDAEPPLGGRPLLRPKELQQLDSLVTVGAHTRTHPALTALADDAVQDEVAGSRRDLEGAVGKPVTLFAYPYGAYDERVRALVKKAGFQGACTVAHGRNPAGTPPLELRRVEIEGTFSLARFIVSLAIGNTHLRRRWRGRLGESTRPEDGA